MSNLNIMVVVLGVALGIGASVLIGFPLLKKKGVNTEELIKDVDLAAKAIEGVAAVSNVIAPNSPATAILDVIKDWAKEGSHQAEQLCIASKLDKDERNAKAKESVYAVLDMLKIKRTDDIDKLIDTAIEAECLALGHKDQTEAEKQAEKEHLQGQVQQLQAENTQLKSTIGTIQSAVSAQ